MYVNLRDLPNAIDEALRGLVLANPGLMLLAGERVVMLRDQEGLRGKVKVVSGGGAGHEPWAVGLVGSGLLTAAVVGDLYTAPPPRAVLAALRHLSCGHFAGVLLVVRNATGDRLSFAAAVQRARDEDLRVAMLLVGDLAPAAERRCWLRGAAATALVCKVAAAMAERGYSLDEVLHLCQDLATNDASISTTSLDMPPALPAVDDSGTRRRTIPTAPPEAALQLLDHLLGWLATAVTDPKHPLVLFIDNTGISPKHREYLFAFDILSQLTDKGYNIMRTYCGNFFTAPEPEGFSVTLLRVPFTCVLTYLDTPTSAPIWPRHLHAISELDSMTALHLPLCISLTLSKDDSEMLVARELTQPCTEKFASSILQVLTCAAKALVACEKQLNSYDEVGGGRDCGTNMKKGAKAVESAINCGELDGHDLFTLFRNVSRIMEVEGSGSSCTLHAIFFEAASKAFRDVGEHKDICEAVWLEALEYGTKAVSYCGNATYGTLVDACSAAATKWRQKLLLCETVTQKSEEWTIRLESVVSAAEIAAMLTVHLRPDISIAIMPDPGAYAVGVWMRAAYEVCKLIF